MTFKCDVICFIRCACIRSVLSDKNVYSKSFVEENKALIVETAFFDYSEKI